MADQKRISLVGADTWPVEVVPNPDKKLAFPVHQGADHPAWHFHSREFAFDSLVADKSYHFAYIFAPMKLKGGTGAPNPIRRHKHIIGICAENPLPILGEGFSYCP